MSKHNKGPWCRRISRILAKCEFRCRPTIVIDAEALKFAMESGMSRAFEREMQRQCGALVVASLQLNELPSTKNTAIDIEGHRVVIR